MKNNILRVFLFALLFVNVSVFAQQEQNGGGGGTSPECSICPTGGMNDQEGDGTQDEYGIANSTPINSNIYLLAGAGVLVGAYFFNRKQLVKA